MFFWQSCSPARSKGGVWMVRKWIWQWDLLGYPGLPDISAVLPPIDEPIYTLDMQYHCMNNILNTINTFNPGQITVDTIDQPIFALTKELMIRFPDKFGPDKYFCLFGSHHIEKSLLIICGQVIKSIGLDEVIWTCGLSVVGADSLLTAP